MGACAVKGKAALGAPGAAGAAQPVDADMPRWASEQPGLDAYIMPGLPAAVKRLTFQAGLGRRLATVEVQAVVAQSQRAVGRGLGKPEAPHRHAEAEGRGVRELGDQELLFGSCSR